MVNPSPMSAMHEREEAGMMAYGEGVEVAASFEPLEIEYAAVRKAAGLMDEPQRGLIEIAGGDRADFLHRMVSHDCKSLKAGEGRRAFLLNNKGRILADLIVLAEEDRFLVDVDLACAAAVVGDLDKYLFSEDVRLADLSGRIHRLSLHGPKAGEILREAAGVEFGIGGALAHGAVEMCGEKVVVYRDDQTGETGLHLWVSAERAEAVYGRLMEAGAERGLKQLGWMAFNTARIEAGTPLFFVDFSTDSLPHETGVLEQAVSFTKGCYTGQEVVARMQSLGHPAKVLVGFRSEGEALPAAGTALYASADAEAKVVGGVTSSTFSPMLSNANVGFAVVKWAHREEGTRLFAQTERGRVEVEVSGLRFFASRR